MGERYLRRLYPLKGRVFGYRKKNVSDAKKNLFLVCVVNYIGKVVPEYGLFAGFRKWCAGAGFSGKFVNALSVTQIL